MDAKPLIDRLLLATAASRQRDAARQGSPDVDEQSLGNLAFARELKKLHYVEPGCLIVAALWTRFEDWGTKYEAAGSSHGIACLHDRAKVLRAIADSFQDAGTTIRTFVEIEEERTRGATAAKQTRMHRHRSPLCGDHGRPRRQDGISTHLTPPIRRPAARGIDHLLHCRPTFQLFSPDCRRPYKTERR